MLEKKPRILEKNTSCLANTATENTASSFQELQSKKCRQVSSSAGVWIKSADNCQFSLAHKIYITEKNG